MEGRNRHFGCAMNFFSGSKLQHFLKTYIASIKDKERRGYWKEKLILDWRRHIQADWRVFLCTRSGWVYDRNKR